MRSDGSPAIFNRARPRQSSLPFLSPLRGLLSLVVTLTHGLRRGLHSCAPPELGTWVSRLLSLWLRESLSHLLGACGGGFGYFGLDRLLGGAALRPRSSGPPGQPGLSPPGLWLFLALLRWLQLFCSGWRRRIRRGPLRGRGWIRRVLLGGGVRRIVRRLVRGAGWGSSGISVSMSDLWTPNLRRRMLRTAVLRARRMSSARLSSMVPRSRELTVSMRRPGWTPRLQGGRRGGRGRRDKGRCGAYAGGVAELLSAESGGAAADVGDFDMSAGFG